MDPMQIDLRSDTVTRPTPGMLDAMLHAEVGDDVLGNDPTALKLQTYAATLFGMEEALFFPSGTMANQVAVKAHTQPGSEIILDETAHIYLYEGGGPALHSGCSVALLPGDRGRISAAQVEGAIRGDDVHFPVTRLVCLENTANRGGGACYDLAAIQDIRAVCDRHGLALHLDGARLMNALVARGESARDYGAAFHSISLCLSKGLGAPAGSLLLGTHAFIRQARRLRKVFGGGMRQVGFLAAAGLYALEQQTARLAEDHAHARQLASVLATQPWVAHLLPPETNILVFTLRADISPTAFLQWLREQGILAVSFGGQRIRFVTHLDISPEMVTRVCEILPHFPS